MTDVARIELITRVRRLAAALGFWCLAGLALSQAVGCRRKDDAYRCGDGAEALDESEASRAAFRKHKHCIVHLHGKGVRGAPSALRSGGVMHVCPNGNAEGWGQRQWLYFPEASYREVQKSVAAALDEAGCGEAIIHGFSNGAAAAAKLHCGSETFSGRVRGYVVDDPVPDHATEACKPADGVRVALYWSGGLTEPVPGWRCAERDWTCEGGSTVGIEAFAQGLRTPIQRSPHREHRPYETPPEHTRWW